MHPKKIEFIYSHIITSQYFYNKLRFRLTTNFKKKYYTQPTITKNDIFAKILLDIVALNTEAFSKV